MQDKIIELLSRAGIDSHVIDMNEYSPANNSDAEFMQEVADYWAKKSTERVVRTKLANSSRLANFGSAPLPFQGQKSGFHREMVAHLKSVLTTDGGGYAFIDLFGGSGLLSHHIKQAYPEAVVVYNDYDNYHERLKHLEHTNETTRRIWRTIAEHNAFEYPQQFPLEVTQAIKATLEQVVQETGYLDPYSIGASFCFATGCSNSLEDLMRKRAFYNRFTKTGTTRNAHGYLAGVVRVSVDWQQLADSLAELKQSNKIVLILDPPYLSTNTTGYKIDYWTLRSFMQVISLIKSSGHPFILFSSSKSNILEYLEFDSQMMQNYISQASSKGLEFTLEELELLNPFAHAITITRSGMCTNVKLETGEYMIANLNRCRV